MSQMADKRYQAFLSTYDFFSNNIRFRIHSSKALEKWKNVQSFQLNQLINGRFYFPFDRREILLLKYDLWSRWLYEIENLCIEMSGDHLDNKTTDLDIEYIIFLAEKTADKYENIILHEYPDRFDIDFAKIWLEIHEDAFVYMLNVIRTFSGLSFDLFYTALVDLLCEVMQYTLTEIYELDMLYCENNIKCKECRNNYECQARKQQMANEHLPFLIVSPLSIKAHQLYGESFTCKRLKKYKRYFDIEEVYIKNYTDGLIHQDILDCIENLGVKINYKRCISEAMGDCNDINK